MCDGNNNRILIWTSLPDDKNVLPDLVLGQPDVNGNDPGTGLDEINWPVAVSVGDNGTPIVVADTYNNRLLIWKSVATSNGQAADYAIQGHSVTKSNEIPAVATGNFA